MRAMMRWLPFIAVAAAVGCNAILGIEAYGPGPTDAGPPGTRDAAPSEASTVDSGDAASGPFTVTPDSPQTISVVVGQAMPVVMFSAMANNMPANVTWSIDRAQVGLIGPGPAATTTFTPTGSVGGLATITATLGSSTLQRQVFVKLSATQNGLTAGNAAEQTQVPTSVAALSQGGGIGGVGGEGLGVAVQDPTTLSALAAPASNGSTESLALLYPYDGTVWPQGLPAPQLMWTWTPGDADAIRIDLATTTGSFSYSGTFGRPAILTQTSGNFIRHPIPEDIWAIATNTAGGPTLDGSKDQLTLKLTVARSGTAYGPLSETWTVAPGPLSGVVYYNSYGTQLVKNWVNLDAAGHSVGAAILAVRSGDLTPSLIVGTNSPTNAMGNPADDTGCHVCHNVASHGRWLITQTEQGTPADGLTYLYDLSSANVQASQVALTEQGTFSLAAMTGDGSYALTDALDPSSTNPSITNSSAGTATSSFWKFGPTPQSAPLTGLPAGVGAGAPVFAPDDSAAAYIAVTGTTKSPLGPLVMASYNASTQTFGTPSTIATPAAGQSLANPHFLPPNNGIVFETQVRVSQSDALVVTRDGARSELWWSSLGPTPMALALATLNGKSGATSYLPVLPNNHGIAGATDPQSSYNETGWDDTTLNYEPSVLPISTGGYVWVVFTTRRAYGNQLDSVPWLSWPPDYDTTQLAQAPTKKLWIAAIDLSAAPGTDPSHPAFYMPGQEILAGNSRARWALDACRPDGTACDSGDQCCNGYCENGGAGPVCASSSPRGCGAVQEHCASASDCCDPTNSCVDGFCAMTQ